jgi:hypothetical protein
MLPEKNQAWVKFQVNFDISYYNVCVEQHRRYNN